MPSELGQARPRRPRRVEYRPPDPAGNGYLAFAAMLMAGLDGIENRIDPGEPMVKDSNSQTDPLPARPLVCMSGVVGY